MNLSGPGAFDVNGVQIGADGVAKEMQASNIPQVVDMAKFLIAAVTDVEFKYSGRLEVEVTTNFSVNGSSKPLRKLLASPLCGIQDE